MKAICYDRYGPASVLELREVPADTGLVRVKVMRAALNPKDSFIRKGRFAMQSGRRFPKRCGFDGAGVVIESQVARFQPGQRVFGFINEWACRRGTLAEEAVFEPHELAALPDGVDDEAAAGIALAGSTALQALRDVARTGPGHRVLINGASGGVGTFAIQIAKVLGAEVHTLTSETNRAFCAELGAHHTHGYETAAWREAAPFHTVFDVFGNLKPASVKPLLAKGGTFVSTVPTPGRLFKEALSRLVRQTERLVVVKPAQADLDLLAGWLRDGQVRTVIDSRFALAEAQAAFARLESKRTRGKIVITV